MTLSETYAAGGAPFMHPITLTFIVNIVVILTVIMKLIQKKEIESRWVEAIKQLGGFALAYGTFGTIMGFFFAFSDLSSRKETLPLNVISGGVVVALITEIYGLIVFMISLFTYILVRIFGKNLIA